MFERIAIYGGIAAAIGLGAWLLLRTKKAEGALEEKVEQRDEDIAAAKERARATEEANASVARHMSNAEAMGVVEKGGL